MSDHEHVTNETSAPPELMSDADADAFLHDLRTSYKEKRQRIHEEASRTFAQIRAEYEAAISSHRPRWTDDGEFEARGYSQPEDDDDLHIVVLGENGEVVSERHLTPEEGAALQRRIKERFS
ncbi:Uncharacterised protein [Mycobacteroides abscessus subsp. abscessus]|uniref:hypothetical protein n=1 Tax=Mycobacteroides abscessus TaxID=36809 RepID=UPI00092A28EE|nr:hypothetical protein [Mycobacteroides abscessus]SHU25696.1 Uncharacterised protein [Mycobacteroides abscessus subsp. abscessus]